MALTHAQRTRFARHILLPELGEAGQERLALAKVRAAEHGDLGATAVARDYLERAGVDTSHPRAEEGTAFLITAREVERLAGRPELMEAARALAGAFTAVETIKAVLAIGARCELPSTLSLASEEA